MLYSCAFILSSILTKKEWWLLRLFLHRTPPDYAPLTPQGTGYDVGSRRHKAWKLGSCVVLGKLREPVCASVSPSIKCDDSTHTHSQEQCDHLMWWPKKKPSDQRVTQSKLPGPWAPFFSFFGGSETASVVNLNISTTSFAKSKSSWGGGVPHGILSTNKTGMKYSSIGGSFSMADLGSSIKSLSNMLVPRGTDRLRETKTLLKLTQPSNKRQTGLRTYSPWTTTDHTSHLHFVLICFPTGSWWVR